MLTYINKELYFIIHSNQKFKRELNFVKCIAKNNDWEIFLCEKLNEIFNEFKKIKLYRNETCILTFI